MCVSVCIYIYIYTHTRESVSSTGKTVYQSNNLLVEKDSQMFYFKERNNFQPNL